MKEFIHGLSHIGIPTCDLKATKEFYEGLGFTVEDTGTEKGQDSVYFVSLQGVVFEIYKSDHVENIPGAVNHIALDVSDITGAYLKAKEKGYKFKTPGIVSVPDFIGKGSSYFMIEGVNHEIIEFNKTPL